MKQNKRYGSDCEEEDVGETIEVVKQQSSSTQQ